MRDPGVPVDAGHGSGCRGGWCDRVRRNAAATTAILSILAGSLVSDTPAQPCETSRHRLSLNGRTLVYHICVPGQDHPGALPLLLLFHGSGRDAQSVLRPWSRFGASEGIVLVSPEAARKHEWTVPADGPEVLRALVTDAAARVPRVDLRRTYLFGHSAGGVFALYMGLIQPEFFAAAVAHAAAFGGEVDAARLPRASRPISLLLLSRAGDEIYPVEQARTTTAVLNEAGCRAELRLLDGGHSYGSREAERVNELAWQFLRGQRLAAAPRFLEYRSNVP